MTRLANLLLCFRRNEARSGFHAAIHLHTQFLGGNAAGLGRSRSSNHEGLADQAEACTGIGDEIGSIEGVGLRLSIVSAQILGISGIVGF